MNTRPSFLSPLTAIVAAAMMTLVSHGQTPADQPVVAGSFVGDGKDGNIKHLLVQTAEPFSGKPAIELIFTEKDPSASKRPAFDAGFKKLGSALVISTHRDGGVFGCEVAHSAHAKSPFSSVGRISIRDIKVTDTHISGVLTTGGESEFFGQKWSVDLTFSAPLPKGAFAAGSEPPPVPSGKSGGAAGTPPAPAGPKPAAATLPLPDGALEVDYEETVGQITFRSDRPVSTVAKDFAAKLKEQGWRDAPGSLTAKANAILKRKLDAAELTIMIQTASRGCTVKVFTQGLDSTNSPASAGAAKPASPPDAVSIKAEADRKTEEALKLVPKL